MASSGSNRAQRQVRYLGENRRDPGLRGFEIAVVVDAGPLYAYVDADDRHHKEALAFLESYPSPLIVPTLVITEAVYLIGTRLGVDQEVRFLGDIAAGDFQVEPVAASDWLRIAELVSRYRDLPLGTVDASVVATCERLGIGRVATFDRRHFGVVRSDLGNLRLLP